MRHSLFLVLAVLWGVTTPVWADEPVALLFVQSAAAMAFEPGSPATLTLKNVSPTVVFFSDRPERMAGHVSLKGFLDAWTEGADSFAEDPPNANLSVVGGGTLRNTVLALGNPRYDGADLTYDVVEISGDGGPPAKGDTVALFIDGLFSGGPLRSGGRGAALGAIGGAIGGDAGKGAAIGAAVGVLGGAIRRSEEQQQYYRY